MADIDPLGIVNSEVQVGLDGVPRRANEKVTRNYMQFGNFFFYLFFSLNFVLEKNHWKNQN